MHSFLGLCGVVVLSRSPTSPAAGVVQAFIKELARWLIKSSVGRATLGLSLAVFACVCTGCFCQHVECEGCKMRRKAEPVRV